MAGRDTPKRRRRCELRRRVPQRLPARVEPAEVRALLAVARSARDRALLTVLWRTGQRIGDWSEEHGRHGVPGMRLGDLDHASGTVAVCLKGAAMSTGCRSAPTSGPVYAAYVRRAWAGRPGRAGVGGAAPRTRAAAGVREYLDFHGAEGLRAPDA